MAFVAGAAVVFVGGMVGAKVVLNKINASQAEEDNAPKVIFVLGGPGSGKGTNCSRIVKEFGYHHLSAGDLLRAERASGSKLGEMIEGLISQGKIVPSDVTVRLLKEAMEKSPGSGKFLIDGFPRNQENLDVWLRDMEHCTIQFVLNLDCPESVMEQRLLSRGETSGRSDDNIEAIRKRFRTHVESTLPVIEHFKKMGKVVTVDSGRDQEMVYADVRRALAPGGKVKYGFYDGQEKPARSSSAGGGDVDDVEGGKGVDSEDAPVLYNIYEAPDGFRGSYEEVLAHEAELEAKASNARPTDVVHAK
jgi:UMP-CMP kinase